MRDVERRYALPGSIYSLNSMASSRYQISREELLNAAHRNFLLSDVEPRHALAHGAQQIRGDRPDAARHAIRRQYFLALRAINGGHIADLCVLHVRDIDHGHVHGDDAHDGYELPA